MEKQSFSVSITLAFSPAVEHSKYICLSVRRREGVGRGKKRGGRGWWESVEEAERERDSEMNTCSVVGRSFLQGCHLCYGGSLSKWCSPCICCHWICERKKNLYICCWWQLRSCTSESHTAQILHIYSVWMAESCPQKVLEDLSFLTFILCLWWNFSFRALTFYFMHLQPCATCVRWDLKPSDWASL